MMFPWTFHNALSYYYTLISLLFQLNVKMSCCVESWRVCGTIITLCFSSFETVLLKTVRHMCYTQLSWVSLWIGGVSLLEESDHAVVDLWSSGPVSGDLQIQSSGRRLQDGELIFREINSRWASMSCGCCFIHQTRPSLTHSYSLHSFFSVCFLHRSLFISSLISSSCIYGSRCGKRRYKPK